jgi:hypothetical protein
MKLTPKMLVYRADEVLLQLGEHHRPILHANFAPEEIDEATKMCTQEARPPDERHRTWGA